MTVRIITGDALESLRQMPRGAVHCCVTSPPYFGLRDYGVDGQIGLEATPDLFVERLVEVFREVRRVLRDDGTLWLNLGDSYAGSWGAQGHRITESDAPSWHGSQIRNHPKRASKTGSIHQEGLKPKDMVGIPWMVAFALRSDGWFLRSDIIWSKPNPMPESVTDRPTKAHEYLFLLSKSERYHYDGDAVREPYNEASVSRYETPMMGTGSRIGGHQPGKKNIKVNEAIQPNPLGRNRRTVWTVATQPFSEAHFATFPPALIEPCILAGCPEGGIVLDPFGGAGTTGLVADRLKRDAVLIELNPAYAEMASRRISGDAPLLAEVAAE